MKLSKRERNMLIVSLLLLIAVAVYFFIITPIHDEYNLTKAEFDRVNAQFASVKSQVISDAQMEEIVKGYRSEIAKLEKQLPSILHLEEIIDVMFNHFNNHGIVINNITFNMINSEAEAFESDDDRMGIEKLQAPMSVEEILDEYENSAKLNTQFDIANDLEGEINYSHISYMAISLTFESNYDVLKDVLSGLENLDITAVTSDISVAKNSSSEENEVVSDNNLVVVSLNISIPFYHDNEKEKDYIFDYSFNKGEDYIDHGPFEYDIIENIEDEITYVEPKAEIDQLSISPEFYVSLNSKASDLPAQSMSYYAMNNSELNLNSNNNEKYELNLKQEDSKIFFQYKNDSAAYPSGSATMSVKQKNDAIIVKVFSSNRISPKDNASMTLVLNNDTNKKVLFYVFYDDKDKPRFNVIANKGNFDIIRN